MFLGVLTLAASPFSALPQHDALTEQLVARCERAVEADALDGFAVVVDVGGETVLARGWGRLQGGRRAGPKSVVHAEPLIDMLTAAAAMKLVERGDLTLDAPVSKLLPELAGDGDDALRVVHLMDHSSGLIGWSRADSASDDEPPTAAELLARVAELGQQSPPGTCFEYSESNALVLGAIVERVSETPLAEFIDSKLLADERFASTGFGVEGAPPSSAAPSGAREVAGRLVDSVEGVHPFGEDELSSTPAELVELARAFSAGDIVSARTAGLMLEPRRLADGTPTPVGLGVNRVRLGEVAGFSFGGGAEGTTLHVVRYPETDLTISLVVARESAPLIGLGRDLARLTLGMALDADSEGAELPDDVVEQISGTFQIGCTSLVVRRSESGEMLLELTGSPTRRLVYLGALSFVDAADRDVTVEFQIAEGADRADTMVLVESGLRSEAVRLE